MQPSVWSFDASAAGRSKRKRMSPSRDTEVVAAGNVEIVRGIYDAVARRDNVTPFEVYAEDIVWDVSNASRGGLGPKLVYHGHEGVRQFWRDGVAAFGASAMSGASAVSPWS
jgi:hypothetical protein